MATVVQEKYHWNEKRFQWERVDRVQQYRGHEIASVSTHDDGWHSSHRAYIVTRPSGRSFYYEINKRGRNMKNLKEWIDFNVENNRTQFL